MSYIDQLNARSEEVRRMIGRPFSDWPPRRSNPFLEVDLRGASEPAKILEAFEKAMGLQGMLYHQHGSLPEDLLSKALAFLCALNHQMVDQKAHDLVVEVKNAPPSTHHLFTIPRAEFLSDRCPIYLVTESDSMEEHFLGPAHQPKNGNLRDVIVSRLQEMDKLQAMFP